MMKCNTFCPYCRITGYSYNVTLKKSYAHYKCMKENSNLTWYDDCVVGYTFKDLLKLNKWNKGDVND